MDYKELFALPGAEPILTFGGRIHAEKFEIPAGPDVHPNQLKYDEKVEAVKEPAEPKRELTRAEKARERRAQRVREQAERRERWLRAREEEIAAVPVIAPVHPVVEVRDARMHERIAAAGRAPAEVPVDAPEARAAAEAMDPGTRRMKFWQTINRFQWHNLSDGAIDAATVTAPLNNLNAADRLAFKLEYENVFNGAIEFLRADGMFERNGAASHAEQARIVSHIIALGEDQYTTLIGDPAFLQFLVEAGECQSLNALLPENIRI
jgi:hypothetical protein